MVDREQGPTMWQLVEAMEVRMEKKATERHQVVLDLATRVNKVEVVLGRVQVVTGMTVAAITAGVTKLVKGDF